jgi:hypothetical protein
VSLAEPNKTWDRTVSRTLRDVAVGQDFRYQKLGLRGQPAVYEYGKVLRQADGHVDVDLRVGAGWRAARRFPSLEVEIPHNPEPAA